MFGARIVEQKFNLSQQRNEWKVCVKSWIGRCDRFTTPLILCNPERDVTLADTFIVKAANVKFPVRQGPVFRIVKAQPLEHRTLIENVLVTNVVAK